MDNLKQETNEMTKQDHHGVDFVAATIHELKTSLTAIIVSAELIADELQPVEGSTQGRLIQSIIRNAYALNERLSLLSEMDRTREGDFRCQLEPVEIGQIIHSVADQFYPRIQSREQSLTLELPDSPTLVKADRQYLEQILLTLIDNAGKFTPERGQIKVKAWPDSDKLIVQVNDTGVGIPAKEQERIFEAYYQVKQDKEKNYAGSGLGLTIAKLLVELQGGKIWLESVVGQGSSFFFSLPLQGSHTP